MSTEMLGRVRRLKRTWMEILMGMYRGHCCGVTVIRVRLFVERVSMFIRTRKVTRVSRVYIIGIVNK